MRKGRLVNPEKIDRRIGSIPARHPGMSSWVCVRREELPASIWSPGIQTQAWSRVLTPRPQAREVECHILLTKYSIDSHIYGTFYSKIAAAEQALYGRTLTKADKSFDVFWKLHVSLR